MRTRSSHSLSSYNTAASRLLRPSRLSYQSPFHSWTSLCRPLHPEMPLRMLPRRLLISRSPCYLLMWQCRRLPTVSISHLWMLPYRRPHKVLRLSTSLHRLVLAQLPRFLLIFLFRLPHAVWCYTMLPYNYRSRSSLLAVFSRTILWTAKTLFVSPPSSVQGPRDLLQPPPGLEQLAPPPDLATSSHLHTTHGASTSSYLSHAPQPLVCTTQVGTHPVRSATTGKRSASTALAGTHHPVGADPRTGTGPFRKPRAWSSPWSTFRTIQTRRARLH